MAEITFKHGEEMDRKKKDAWVDTAKIWRNIIDRLSSDDLEKSSLLSAARSVGGLNM